MNHDSRHTDRPTQCWQMLKVDDDKPVIQQPAFDWVCCVPPMVYPPSCVLLCLHVCVWLQVPCRLVLLASSDTPGTSLLLQLVASRCHVTADIQPVQGRTAALDGSMTVNTRRAPPHTRSNQQQHASAGQSAVGSSVGGNAGISIISSSGVLRPGWLQPGCSSVWFFRCGDVGLKWLSEVHGKELLG